MVSRDNVKKEANSNASKETPCYDAVNLLKALIVD